MLEICPSGLMSGIWKRSTYVPLRQISTLHALYEVARLLRVRQLLNSRFASVEEPIFKMNESIHIVENFLPPKSSRIGPALAGADSAAGACIDHILSKIKILRNLRSMRARELFNKR